MIRPRFAFLPVYAICIGGLLVTAFTSWITREVVRRLDADVFRADIAKLTSRIEDRFRVSAEILFELRSRLKRPLSVTNLPAFGQLAEWVPKNNMVGISGVGLALVVQPSELSAHEAMMKERLATTNYQVSPSGQPYKRVIANDHEFATFMLYLPVATFDLLQNMEAGECCQPFKIGTDLLRASNRLLQWQASPILEAAADGALRIGGVLEVSSDNPKQLPLNLVSYYLPVYRDGSSRSQAVLSERFAELQGMLIATINAGDCIRTMVQSSRSSIAVEVFFGSKEYDRKISLVKVFSSEARSHVQPYQVAESEVRIGGYYLFLNAHSLLAWDYRSWRFAPWVIATLGILLTALSTRYVTRHIREKLISDDAADELRTTNAALAAARTTREDITRELHDNTLQTLYALSLELRKSREDLRNSPESVDLSLERCLAEIRSISSELRQFLTEETSFRQRLSLQEVLSAIVQRFQRGSTAQIGVVIDPAAATRLSIREVAESAQIVREAISNALRHANPKTISVSLSRHSASGWQLEVRDDGCGFDVATSSRSGFGLKHLAKRAQAIGAQMRMESVRNQGTRIRISSCGTDSDAGSTV